MIASQDEAEANQEVKEEDAGENEQVEVTQEMAQEGEVRMQWTTMTPARAIGCDCLTMHFITSLLKVAAHVMSCCCRRSLCTHWSRSWSSTLPLLPWCVLGGGIVATE